MILITGGAGFIGSHLVDRLLAEGQEVICLDNFNDYYDPSLKRRNIAGNLKNPQFMLIEGDIRDKSTLDSIMTGQRIDKVVHLAARAGVRPSILDPELYEEVNVKGTLSLLEACRQHGIRQFVFGSSSSVYGVNTKVPFSEEDKVDFPISPYAATKRAGELLCYTYHNLYKIQVSCLRFFTVYGPRHRPDMAIHKFTKLIDSGEEVPVFGDGTSKRDYTFVSDIVDGLVRAIDSEFDYEIINLGDSRVVELNYLIEVLERNLGKNAKITYLPEQLGDVPITYADITKATKLLNYQPKVAIEEGIERFVKWYREQQ